MKIKDIKISFFNRKKSRGFTLVELLIVIAIIGTLSSITITALSRTRDKAQDVKIKAELAQLSSNAELFHGKNGNYGPETSDCSEVGSFFMDDSSVTLISAAELASGDVTTCVSNDDVGAGTASSWAVSIPLRSNPLISWCVKSVGGAEEGTAQISGNTATCI